MEKKLFFGALLAAGSLSSPARANLPDPVTIMIETALKSGVESDIEAVAKIAKAANPEEVAAVDALLADYRAEQVRQAALAAAEAEKIAAEQQAELAKGRFFDNWAGKGDLGAFRSTGNARNSGISGGLKLVKTEEDWRLKFQARADYQRSNGVTTKEQYGATLEPNYKFNKRLYAYGLAQYERDEFQGFSSRYTVSGGLGYTIVDTGDINLNIKAGPAYRITDFVTGGTDNSLAALFGLDFDWQISDNLKLSQDAGAKIGSSSSAIAIISSGSSSFNATTALDTKLLGALSARFSYTVEHETNPPVGSVKTDTVSRVTIVYDF